MPAADKAYEGTTTATLTSCTVSGIEEEHIVTCGGTAAFDTATVGAGKSVTASDLTLTEPDAGYYALASTIAGPTATITPLPVMPTVTAADKPHDGTTAAALARCIVTGAVDGDEVASTGAAAFDSPTIGTGKTVTVGGITLIGDANANYTLASTTATTTATITALTLTPAVSVADKVYDGTTSATLTGCTVTGVLDGDDVGCAGTTALSSATVTTTASITAGTKAPNGFPSTRATCWRAERARVRRSARDDRQPCAPRSCEADATLGLALRGRPS